MTVLTKELYASLVYLDRDFLAGRYEIQSGESPHSQVTKTQTKKAGAAIPIFSAEVSAVETRAYPISTLEMLAVVLPVLEAEPRLAPKQFEKRMSSMLGWVDGYLSTLTVSMSKKKPGTDDYVSSEEQGYFTLENQAELKLALITSPDYFLSGLDTLTKMHKVAVRDLAIPVRALVRVIAAQSHADQWIAVPYVIFEQKSTNRT